MLAQQSKKLCIIILLYTQIFHYAHSRTDSYCESTIDIYRYSEKLHFVGEIGDLDFGVVNMTKTLHCCAYGFTRIEWLKNNKPYPWSPTTSSFMVDASTGNQTLISGRAKMSDSGVYTCIVRNGSSVIMHDIELEILAPESAHNPRLTYATKDQTGNIGDFARLYCEGFVGMDKKSNFSGTIKWEKGLSLRYLDRAFIDGYRVIQLNYRRDENQILGSYLIFMNVEPDDMNMYTCRISNGNHRAVEQRAWILDSRDPEELARMLFMAVFAILPMFSLASVLALLAGMVFPVDIISVYVRKVISRYYGIEDISKDVLVVYHTNAKRHMTKTITPKFLDLYPVKVTLYPIYTNEQDYNKLLKKAKTYDGVMAIFMRSLAGKKGACERIYLSVKMFGKLPTFICILPERLPPLQGKNGQKLKETLRRENYQVISWRKTLCGKVLKTYLRKMKRNIRRRCANHVDTKRNKVNDSPV